MKYMIIKVKITHSHVTRTTALCDMSHVKPALITIVGSLDVIIGKTRQYFFSVFVYNTDFHATPGMPCSHAHAHNANNPKVK